MKFEDIFKVVRMNRASMTCVALTIGEEVYMTRRIFNTLLVQPEANFVIVTKEDPMGQTMKWVALVEANIF